MVGLSQITARVAGAGLRRLGERVGDRERAVMLMGERGNTFGHLVANRL